MNARLLYVPCTLPLLRSLVMRRWQAALAVAWAPVPAAAGRPAAGSAGTSCIDPGYSRASSSARLR